MKKLIILSASLFSAAIAFSQVSLSYVNNALVLGDSVACKEIQYVSPGEAGANQMWDFSMIQYTGTNPVSHVGSTSAIVPSAIGNYNLTLSENGYNYFYYGSGSSLIEEGYTTNEFSLSYSNPLTKIKYPFSYGDNFTDDFAGNAFYSNGGSVVNFSGTYTLTADAYGTLILPGRYIKNALRVKSVKQAIEVNPCSSTDAEIIRYAWYAPGYRYPVFILLTKEYTRSGQEPTITKTGFVSLQMGLSNPPVVPLYGTNNGPIIEENDDFTVLSYPNPFTDNLSYSYYLRKDMPVSIELYDITGKFSMNLADQLQSDGVHSGTFDAADISLTPGVYYLRFTFDKKVVVTKVVKM
jgi:hypothetical protein